LLSKEVLTLFHHFFHELGGIGRFLIGTERRPVVLETTSPQLSQLSKRCANAL
jgi:hypothetical protein